MAALFSLSLKDPLAATLADVTVDPRRSDPATAADGAFPPAVGRRSVMEVAADGLFDIFGFQVGASASFDPLCEFINPLLDDEHKLNCGERRRA